nr:TonB-dependent receptor [Cytophagales bacterium]
RPDGSLYTCQDFTLPPNQIDLFEYLLANNKLEQIRDYDESLLHIISDNVLAMIKAGTEGWEIMVPTQVARIIKDKRLFGYPAGGSTYTPLSEVAANSTDNSDPGLAY